MGAMSQEVMTGVLCRSITVSSQQQSAGMFSKEESGAGDDVSLTCWPGGFHDAWARGKTLTQKGEKSVR
jgi:hypothetical protein